NNLPQEVIQGTSGWRQIGTSLTAPDSAAALEIHLALAGPGEVWFEAIDVSDNRLALEAAASPPRQSPPYPSASQAAAAEAEQSSGSGAVGWANPMQRVFLRDVPATVNYRQSGRIEAFRGEIAAIQLVIGSLTVDLD